MSFEGSLMHFKMLFSGFFHRFEMNNFGMHVLPTLLVKRNN